MQVTFRPNQGDPAWVPEEMTEHYDILNSDGARMATVTGHATYSNARTFALRAKEE